MDRMTYQGIPGWFNMLEDYKDGYDRTPAGGTVVEVGAWFGRSTAFFADMIRKGKKPINFFSVDPWTPINDQKGICLTTDTSHYGVFLQNMAACGVLQYVTPIRLSSLEASQLFENNSIDVLFIDGAHDAVNIETDLYSWLPKCKDGGMICGDDYHETWPAVIATVKAMLPNHVLGKGGNTWRLDPVKH